MAMAIALFLSAMAIYDFDHSTFCTKVYITASTKLPMGCIQLKEINCQSQAHINPVAGRDMSDGLL